MIGPLAKLRWYSRVRPSRLAWSLSDGDVSYFEAYQRARQLESVLRELTVGPGSKVAISGSQQFQCLAASALLSMGKVISIYPQDPAKRSAVESSFDQLVTNLEAYKSPLPTFICSPGLSQGKARINSWRELRSSLNTAGIVLFTSGTTGRTKLIELSYQKLIYRHRAHSSFFRREDRTMTFFPMFSAIGFYFYMDSILRGITFVGPGDYQYTKGQIEKMQINCLVVSPAAIQEFIELAKDEGYRPTSIKKVVCTGGVISNKLAELITEFFRCSLEIHYGSTETGKVSVVRFDQRVSEGDQGQPMPGVVVEIVDSHDKLVPAGQEGRVRIKTDSLAGYLDKDPSGASAIQNGYFYPGDIGRLSKENRLEVLGRADLVANLSGVKVSLEEYEKYGRDLLGLNCVAFTFQDAAGISQVGLGFTNTGLDQIVISSSYQMKFAKQSPALFAWMKSIPLTDTGKPDRKRLALMASLTGN